MIYLKKFNENLNMNLKDIIDEYFIYVSDETKIHTSLDNLGENSITTIKLLNEDDNIEDFENLIKLKTKNLNILNLTKDAINRLKDSLIDYNITHRTNSKEINIRISLHKENFYIKKDNIIIIDINMLLKMMSITSIYNVTINYYLENYYMNLEFRDEYTQNKNDILRGDLDDYVKELGKSIKIDDKPLFKEVHNISVYNRRITLTLNKNKYQYIIR
jgi:hypothetical protein